MKGPARKDAQKLFEKISSMSTPEMEAFLETADAETTDTINAYIDYLTAAPQRAAASLIEFARYMNPDPNDRWNAAASKYQVAPHHRLLAEALTEVLEGRLLRLAISMPPQHGKSTLATRLLLAYHVGKFPWKHLLMGTYNQTFAEEFGDDVRAIINSEEYPRVFPGAASKPGVPFIGWQGIELATVRKLKEFLVPHREADEPPSVPAERLRAWHLGGVAWAGSRPWWAGPAHRRRCPRLRPEAAPRRGRPGAVLPGRAGRRLVLVHHSRPAG